MSPRAASRLETLGFTDVYDYDGGKPDRMAYGLPIEGEDAGTPRALDVVRPAAPSCTLDAAAGEVLPRMAAGGWSWTAVLGSDSRVLGQLRRGSLEGKPVGARVEELMEAGPSTYRPSIPCEEMVSAMKQGQFESAFITDSDGRWIGLLSRQDAE